MAGPGQIDRAKRAFLERSLLVVDQELRYHANFSTHKGAPGVHALFTCSDTRTVHDTSMKCSDTCFTPRKLLQMERTSTLDKKCQSWMADFLHFVNL